jgi:hypothetical protein
VTICPHCSLLCEFDREQTLVCPLRARHLAAVGVSRRGLPSASTVPAPAPLLAARRRIAHASRILITGRILTVETSRQALRLAKQLQAFIDVEGSEAAFPQIRAVQRGGMIHASLSEIAFRSDVLLILGHDGLLASFPRLASRLVAERPSSGDGNGRRSLPRVVLMGRWSLDSLDHFRRRGIEVRAVEIDIAKIPQALMQWSRLTAAQQSMSDNVVSRWLHQAEHLAAIWSPGCLGIEQADLWIERLGQWLEVGNQTRRCVGLPLAGETITFQQVCTWTTGFPGRVQFEGSGMHYRPERTAQPSTAFDLIIRVDESDGLARIAPSGEFGRVEATVAASAAEPPSGLAGEEIVIGPTAGSSSPSAIHLLAGVAGVDYRGIFFRGDASVCIEVGPSSGEAGGVESKPAWEWLQALGEAGGC